MKRKALLQECERLITTFDPAITTVDAHAATYLGDTATCGKLTSRDKKFMSQVLYGVNRYSRILKIFLTHFYHDNAAKTSRNDVTLYNIMAYLIFFRLSELKFETLESFIKSQDPTSMYVLMCYIRDARSSSSLIEEWKGVTDMNFIENQMFGLLTGEYKTALDECIESCATRAFGQNNTGETASNTFVADKTTPIGFPNLTKPKMRSVIEPMKIEQVITGTPIPPESASLADIARKSTDRSAKIHAATLQKYENTGQNMVFHETTSNLESIRATVEAERASHERFSSFRAKPAPDFSKTPAAVKLTVASVLREDALYKKKQEKEAALIKSYESNLRDSSEFYRWQSSALAQDEAAAAALVEQRRVDMAASAAAAAKAIKDQKVLNAASALEIKAQAKENLATLSATAEALRAEKQELATKVYNHRVVAPGVAREKILRQNTKSRVALKEESAKMWEAKLEADALEMAEKQDVIRQIRALERVHEPHTVVFDPTSTANIGLLEEMSLVELQERLAMQRISVLERENTKREEIQSSRVARQNMLASKIQNIGKIRSAASNANKSSRARRKAAAASREEALRATRHANNVRLASKLSATRAARSEEAARIAEEEARIAKARLFAGAEKNQIEETHFAQLLAGAERKAAASQLAVQAEAKIAEDVRIQETRQRQKGLKQQLRAAKELYKRQNDIVKAGRTIMKADVQQTLKSKKEIVATEREHYHLQTASQRKRNPYGTMRSDISVESGRRRMMMGHNKSK